MTEGIPLRSHLNRIPALIAQSVEHAAVNRGVTGSSPVWGATLNAYFDRIGVLLFCSETVDT